jgi:hypothetical protein
VIWEKFMTESYHKRDSCDNSDRSKSGKEWLNGVWGSQPTAPQPKRNKGEQIICD